MNKTLSKNKQGFPSKDKSWYICNEKLNYLHLLVDQKFKESTLPKNLPKIEKKNIETTIKKQLYKAYLNWKEWVKFDIVDINISLQKKTFIKEVILSAEKDTYVPDINHEKRYERFRQKHFRGRKFYEIFYNIKLENFKGESTRFFPFLNKFSFYQTEEYKTLKEYITIFYIYSKIEETLYKLTFDYVTLSHLSQMINIPPNILYNIIKENQNFSNQKDITILPLYEKIALFTHFFLNSCYQHLVDDAYTDFIWEVIETKLKTDGKRDHSFLLQKPFFGFAEINLKTKKMNNYRKFLLEYLSKLIKCNYNFYKKVTTDEIYGSDQLKKIFVIPKECNEVIKIKLFMLLSKKERFPFSDLTLKEEELEKIINKLQTKFFTNMLKDFKD